MFRNTCGVGEAVELIINIANVNDNPSPRPISPNIPDRLRLIVDAPPLPYELADHAANEGFSVGKFAKKGKYETKIFPTTWASCK